jgi:hypothetical protein
MWPATARRCWPRPIPTASTRPERRGQLRRRRHLGPGGPLGECGDEGRLVPQVAGPSAPAPRGGRRQDPPPPHRHQGLPAASQADQLGGAGAAVLHPGQLPVPPGRPRGLPDPPRLPGGHRHHRRGRVRVLKAMFNPNFVLPDPVVPSDDGLSLRPWKGEPLTVGGELNKLAFNMASAATPPGSTSAETRSKASCSPSCTSPAAWPMPTPLLAGHQGALHALDRVPSAAGANPGARLGRTPADEQTAVIAREEVSHGPPATHCAEPGRRRPAPGRHRTTALAGLTATAAD